MKKNEDEEWWTSLNPASYFVWLVFVDSMYQSLWYFKSRLFGQSVYEQYQRFYSSTRRYLLYGLITLLCVHCRLLVHPSTDLWWLTLPPIAGLVYESHYFTTLYASCVKDVQRGVAGVLCVALAKSLNMLCVAFVTMQEEEMNPEISAQAMDEEPATRYILKQQSENTHALAHREMVTASEIQHLWEHLDLTVVWTTTKSLAMGAVTHYLQHSHYQWTSLFRDMETHTRLLYLNQVTAAIRTRNWSTLLTPEYVSKMFLLYPQLWHDFLHREWVAFRDKWMERIIQWCSYWTIAAWFQLYVPYFFISLMLIMSLMERSSLMVLYHVRFRTCVIVWIVCLTVSLGILFPSPSLLSLALLSRFVWTTPQPITSFSYGHRIIMVIQRQAYKREGCGLLLMAMMGMSWAQGNTWAHGVLMWSLVMIYTIVALVYRHPLPAPLQKEPSQDVSSLAKVEESYFGPPETTYPEEPPRVVMKDGFTATIEQAVNM